ncbi:hypothetical protein F4859DRAFT_505103 [Xylaria cf. heliscus]|nr:hypothetical protein F4859DRAFT_505103 [Xylaria cf. heliscus]
MSHTARSSSASSPQSDLRPAPLRIPVRKTVARPDDNHTIAVNRYKLGARNISTSTLSREHPSQHPQSYIIPRTLPHRRRLGTKLQSLKSQFEILHAVNSADTSTSQYPNSPPKVTASTIPRASKPKHNLPRNLLSPSPVEPISRASTELSPRQSRTPAAPAHSPCTTSTIPVLRHSRPFITPRGAPSSRLPKSKSSRNNSPSLRQASSTTVLVPQRGTQWFPNKAVPGKQETSQTLGEASKPSVADLRRSFEKPTLQSVASCRDIKHNQDMLPSISSKLHVELLPEWSSKLPDGTGQIVDVRPRTKATEKTSPRNPAGGPVGHGPSPSLPKSRRFELQPARQEKTKVVYEPGGLDPLPQPATEEMSQEWGNRNSLEKSMDGLSGVSFSEQLSNKILIESPKVQCERPVTEETRDGGSRPMQGSGKVSRLRRLFERTPSRFSSPLSLISFRSRPAPAEPTSKLQGTYPSSSWNGGGSPTSTTRRRSIVPSLTTEISVNDFFCDFVGSPNCEVNPTPTSPSETVAEMESYMKHESPVKHRIQQFEHISRDSLKVKETDDYRVTADETGLQYHSMAEKQRSGKHNMAGAWRPIHQKGVAIWRKISNSLSRSLDSWKDCDSDHEHLNSTEGLASDACFDRSPPLANDLMDYLHHSSSLIHSRRVSLASPQFIPTSQTAPSIQFGVRDSSNNHPMTSNASYGCSSPDTPFQPHIARKRPPLIARVSSGFQRPNGFGLDGHFPSKPVQEEESQPSESRTSGLSTPQGDPNALLKVMLKQSAAERARRREDEKHLHLRRDIKLRSLTHWKGKGKANVDLHLADGATSNGEAGKKQDKGKGKETKEQETNKKTESGFVVFESKDVKLRHPKPRRPGQVRKLTNMYRDKGSSGVSVNTKASSGATVKESRMSFRQRASSAFGRKVRKGS